MRIALFAFVTIGAGISCPEESDVLTFVQPKPVSGIHNQHKIEERADHEEQFFSLEHLYKAYMEVEQKRFHQTSFDQIPGSVSLVGVTEQKIMEPAMTAEEISFFRETLSKADAYLEFGIGGSTVFASQFTNLRCLKGIESSQDWIDSVSADSNASAAFTAGRLELVFVDIGPTQAYGFPDFYSDSYGQHVGEWPKYSSQILTSCGEQPVKHRVVLVDGRFRVACFLKTLLSTSSEQGSKTQIFIHDYGRPAYLVVEQFANVVEIPGDNVCVCCVCFVSAILLDGLCCFELFCSIEWTSFRFYVHYLFSPFSLLPFCHVVFLDLPHRGGMVTWPFSR